MQSYENLDEEVLVERWRWTVRLYFSYAMVLMALGGLIAYGYFMV
jgi:hypothetical protein